jgi:hypothetical protein
MLRCTSCLAMNMQQDEVNGTCYKCHAVLKPHTQQVLASGETPSSGHGLPAAERLMCQIAIVLGIGCFAASAFSAYRGLTYHIGMESAQATVRRDFVGSGSMIHAAATGQTFERGSYDTYAVFTFEGKTYKTASEGHKPGERFTVHFRPEKPSQSIAPTDETSYWFAGGAAMVGLLLVGIGGGAI